MALIVFSVMLLIICTLTCIKTILTVIKYGDIKDVTVIYLLFTMLVGEGMVIIGTYNLYLQTFK